jgi:hypothetical protein
MSARTELLSNATEPWQAGARRFRHAAWNIENENTDLRGSVVGLVAASGAWPFRAVPLPTEPSRMNFTQTWSSSVGQCW